jgi:hypothetical protein
MNSELFRQVGAGGVVVKCSASKKAVLGPRSSVLVMLSFVIAVCGLDEMVNPEANLVCPTQESAILARKVALQEAFHRQQRHYNQRIEVVVVHGNYIRAVGHSHGRPWGALSQSERFYTFL